MSKKFNNKILLIILLVLGSILVFTELFHKTEKNLKTDIVTFNSNEVTKIVVNAKAGENPIIVSKKNDNDWQVTNGQKKFKAEPGIAKNYLDELLKIKSQRLAAKTQDKWEEYQLTDSAAIRIKLYNTKNKSILDILIGKLNYKQAQDPYGRNNVQGISYVRLANEKEIYAVDGFLPMSLNRGFNDWRDKTLTKLRTEDIKKINFIYSDSSYTLEFKDSLWYVGVMLVDSKKVESYLSSLQNKTGNKFNNDFQAVSNPVYQLKIEGDNLTNIEVKCYNTDDGKFAIHSSQNTEATFESDEDGLVKQLFKPLKNFVETSK